MSLLDRYLTAVKFWLPQSQRDDIAAELAANLQSEIDDRAAAQGHPLSEDELAALLKEQGPPLLVASRYRENHRTVNFGRQIIGPIVFPFYWIAIKIALVLLFVPGVISSVFLRGNGTAVSEFGHAISRVVRLSLPALLVVTIIFALIDWNVRRFHLLEKWKERWDPRGLPSAQRQEKQVRRSSSIFGIIFQSLFILWWMKYGSVPSVVLTKAGAHIYFAPVLASLHFPILVIAFVILAQHWINLVEPGWRWLPPLVGIVTSFASAWILYPLLKTPTLISITDRNGVPISPGEMEGIHRIVSITLGSMWLGILIVGVIYAWRLLWIVWKSMPRGPVAPNGKGIALI